MLSSSSFAKEIIMKCDHPKYVVDLTLKYEEGILGFGKSVKRRIKGKWVDFCTYENQTLKITDKGAVCSFADGFKTDDYLWSDGKTDSVTTYHGEWIADFINLAFKVNGTRLSHYEWKYFKDTKNKTFRNREKFECESL